MAERIGTTTLLREVKETLGNGRSEPEPHSGLVLRTFDELLEGFRLKGQELADELRLFLPREHGSEFVPDNTVEIDGQRYFTQEIVRALSHTLARSPDFPEDSGLALPGNGVVEFVGFEIERTGYGVGVLNDGQGEESQGPSSDRKEEEDKQYDKNGMYLSQIAKQAGVSKNAIHHRIRRLAKVEAEKEGITPDQWLAAHSQKKGIRIIYDRVVWERVLPGPIKRGGKRVGSRALSLSRYVRKRELEAHEPDEPTDEDLAELASSAEILENGEDALALGEIEGGRFDDAVYLYLREVGPIPLLTAVEEVDLAQRIERGKETEKFLKSNYSQLTEGERRDLQGVIEDGRKARDHFIKANTRLVISIAKKYIGRGVSFLDLIQEGNVGLIRAVEMFDWRKGFKFSTYATWWIRQAVTRAIGDQGRTIRVPIHMGEKINKMKRFIHKFRQENGEKPTDEEIMKELEVDRKQFELLIRASKRELSLEMPIGEEEDSTLGDLIQDHTVEDVPEKAGLNVLRDEVQEALDSLTPREARILELRYGLGGGRTHTLEEVGRKFDLTRERIRQIEAKALGKLRNPVRARKLREYV